MSVPVPNLTRRVRGFIVTTTADSERAFCHARRPFERTSLEVSAVHHGDAARVMETIERSMVSHIEGRAP